MVLLGLLVILPSTLFGQEKRIRLEIGDCMSTKTSGSFHLTVTNMSNQPIVTYLPKTADICLQILKIKFIDLQNNKVHEFDPCTLIADLDHIILNSKNTLSLKPNEKFTQKVRFSKKDIFPYLKRGKSYKLFVEWRLEGVNFEKEVQFETDLNNLFQENVASNKIDFRN
jgi:hypothetical protein